MTPVATAPVDNLEDTEITLGTGKMLALFFGLVILCATFFGMGYSLGRNTTKATAELLPSPSTSKPLRPLQAASTVNPTNNAVEAATKAPDQQTTPAASTASSSSPSTSGTPPDQAASSSQSAGAQIQPGAGYFVQVAAVSKQEDAEALVDSLKARQYQAFIADPGADKLFHVQVGPFADVKDAESMRTRLVNDGYNPILKK
ncbi:MAG TPA: SPOR domain-containing protein [Terriglobales bacterium]|nr:SPOR domain-containing protein [Terriglobales bacterium]